MSGHDLFWTSAFVFSFWLSFLYISMQEIYVKWNRWSLLMQLQKTRAKHCHTKTSLTFTFQDAGDGSANTETTAYAAYSPLDRHIHVRSSNREISVGKYVVFHVKSNFALTYFDWIIVSKNLILKSGREYASDIHPGNFLRIIN